MNGRSGVAVSAERSDRTGRAGASAGWPQDVPGSADAVRGESVPVRVGRPRSSGARVAPQPSGPGRAASRSLRRAPARPMPARRSAASPGARSRVVAGRMRPVASPGARRAAGWRGVAALVAAGLAAGVTVFVLGTLADVMAQARVPEATGPVVVRADETLPQLAHRAAPSADPSAVVDRIAVLNDLKSPSVQPGQVLVSPIG